MSRSGTTTTRMSLLFVLALLIVVGCHGFGISLSLTTTTRHARTLGASSSSRPTTTTSITESLIPLPPPPMEEGEKKNVDDKDVLIATLQAQVQQLQQQLQQQSTESTEEEALEQVEPTGIMATEETVTKPVNPNDDAMERVQTRIAQIQQQAEEVVVVENSARVSSDAVPWASRDVEPLPSSRSLPRNPWNSMLSYDHSNVMTSADFRDVNIHGDNPLLAETIGKHHPSPLAKNVLVPRSHSSQRMTTTTPSPLSSWDFQNVNIQGDRPMLGETIGKHISV